MMLADQTLLLPELGSMVDLPRNNLIAADLVHRPSSIIDMYFDRVSLVHHSSHDYLALDDM